MARIVKKHPSDFKPGDIICGGGEGSADIEIVEVFGWSKSHGGSYAFLCHDRSNPKLGKTFFVGEFTYKVKR